MTTNSESYLENSQIANLLRARLDEARLALNSDRQATIERIAELVRQLNIAIKGAK